MAWQGVAIEDYQYAELTGQRPVALRPLQWYIDRVHQAMHSNAEVADRFYRVIGFLEPSSALFRPRMLANVSRASW